MLIHTTVYTQTLLLVLHFKYPLVMKLKKSLNICKPAKIIQSWKIRKTFNEYNCSLPSLAALFSILATKKLNLKLKIFIKFYHSNGYSPS